MLPVTVTSVMRNASPAAPLGHAPWTATQVACGIACRVAGGRSVQAAAYWPALYRPKNRAAAAFAAAAVPGCAGLAAALGDTGAGVVAVVVVLDGVAGLPLEHAADAITAAVIKAPRISPCFMLSSPGGLGAALSPVRRREVRTNGVRKVRT